MERVEDFNIVFVIVVAKESILFPIYFKGRLAFLYVTVIIRLLMDVMPDPEGVRATFTNQGIKN